MAMRVTQRSGRIGSAKHNDRSFLDKERDDQALHIDRDKMSDNIYASCLGANRNFEEAEREFYKSRYGQAQELRNERYIKSGHKDRCKTTDELYEGKLTRPEELILQVGNRDEHISSEELYAMAKDYLNEFMKWNREHGSHAHILSMALHVDEATPHIHIRRVWDYEKDGIIELGQNKALEQAGVPLPDPEQKPSRYNNRKMTLDAEFREKWQDICQEHGYNIEREPRPSRRHKAKEDYIAEQMAKEKAEKEAELLKLKAEVEKAEQLSAQITPLEASVKRLKAEKHVLDTADVEKAVKKAQTKPFSKDKVIVDKADFEKISKTAHKAEKLQSENVQLRLRADKVEHEASSIIARAQDKADGIIAKADDFYKSSAQGQLEQIRQDYPEIFNSNGVYQRGHESFRKPEKITLSGFNNKTR